MAEMENRKKKESKTVVNLLKSEDCVANLDGKYDLGRRER